MSETIELQLDEPYMNMLDQLEQEAPDVRPQLAAKVEQIIHETHQQAKQSDHPGQQ